MELPLPVLIHNELIGVKGSPGDLLHVSDHGFYEVNMKFGSKIHRTLLPIETTVLISREPEEAKDEGLDIER